TSNFEHLKEGHQRPNGITELRETSNSSRPEEFSMYETSTHGQPIPASSPPSPPPPTPMDGSPIRRPQRRRARRSSFLVTAIIILLLAATTLGLLFVTAHKNTNTTANMAQVVGHVSFISSEQLYVNNNQGINDEVLINLHNIPAPGSGKSYY